MYGADAAAGHAVCLNIFDWTARGAHVITKHLGCHGLGCRQRRASGARWYRPLPGRIHRRPIRCALEVGRLAPLALGAMLCACSGRTSAGTPDLGPVTQPSPTASPTIRGGAAIWVHPLPDCSFLDGGTVHCSVNALSLFSGSSAWPTVATRSNVFRNLCLVRVGIERGPARADGGISRRTQHVRRD